MIALQHPLPVSETDEMEQFLGRVPVRNLWYLLLYAWDLGHFRDRYLGDVEESPTLKELFSRLFLQVGHDAIRQGLHRSYVTKKASLKGVRGRILFSETIKQNRLHYGEVVCQFDEFQENTLLNQVVKATIRCLMGDLDTDNSPKRKELCHQLTQIYGYFQNVSDIRLHPTVFNRITVPQNNRLYTLWIKLCELICWGAMPTESVGSDVFLKVIKEQITGHQLYERFLRNFYTIHLDEYDVTSEILQWPIEPASRYMPAMRTDISLKPRHTGKSRIIIDAKFYTRTLVQSQYGEPDRFHTGHIYQLYAYLRTQEELGEAYRNAKGILLYPSVHIEVDEQFEIQGHGFKVATVNLALPWQDIEERLLSLVVFAPRMF